MSVLLCFLFLCVWRHIYHFFSWQKLWRHISEECFSHTKILGLKPIFSCARTHSSEMCVCMNRMNVTWFGLSPTILFYIGRPRRKCPRCFWRRCAVSLAYRLRCRSPIYRTCIFVALSCECTVCMRFASTFRRATLFLHQETLTTKYHESLIVPGDPVRSQVFVCQQSFGCRLPGDARPVRMKETNVWQCESDLLPCWHVDVGIIHCTHTLRDHLSSGICTANWVDRIYWWSHWYAICTLVWDVLCARVMYVKL